MKKNFLKILRALLAAKIIFSLLMALPPMGECLALANSQNAGLDLQFKVVFASNDGFASGVVNFIPKLSHEITQGLSKWVESSYIALNDRIVLLDEVKRFVEFSDYMYANDYPLNFLLLSCRQPAREHSSAG
ncbi:hypothetical protein DCC62_13115 [candidate division KSB1 bacterium]|nr:MAG: hypothetical protein DCC62_13115 [candidate division KSB1 bacterium]